jgi:Tol biopolymer transport system component
LVLIDLSSRHITTLMKTNTLEDGPTWAPGGRTFAYEGYLGPNPEDGDAIFKMKVRGRDVTKVVDVCESDAHPAWAPNGRLIAFDGACDNIYVVAPDGGSLHKVAVGEFPTWSPDSRRLAFIKRSVVYVVDLSGGRPQKVQGTKGADDVAWSPDGSRLAFSTWKEPFGGAIFVVPATGGKAVRITPANTPAQSPAWSPDGMWIAYVRVVNRHAQIAVTSLDSSHTEALTPRNADYFSPSWAPP